MQPNITRPASDRPHLGRHRRGDADPGGRSRELSGVAAVIRRLAAVPVALAAAVLVTAGVAGSASAAVPAGGAQPALLSAYAGVPAMSAVPGGLPAGAVHIVTAKPYPNQGMISLTTQVCGTSGNWQAQAAANGVRPPAWTIYLGTSYRFDCAATSLAKTGSKPAAAPPAATGRAWVNPLPGTCRPSGGGGQFGAPRDRDGDGIAEGVHQGIDLGMIEHVGVGRPILAAAGGTVFVAGWVSKNAGYGVEIRHPGGYVTKYFHMPKDGWSVSNGQQVRQGQVIGHVGRSGDATGPHLHFELWHNGKLLNPTNVLGVGC
jgi:murein DD-endopeptidase MepM/ murein hydrolase activator NlpD